MKNNDPLEGECVQCRCQNGTPVSPDNCDLCQSCDPGYKMKGWIAQHKICVPICIISQNV